MQLTSLDQQYTSKKSQSIDSVVAARLADMQRDTDKRIKLQVAAQVTNSAC